jgi:hypothetical protein
MFEKICDMPLYLTTSSGFFHEFLLVKRQDKGGEYVRDNWGLSQLHTSNFVINLKLLPWSSCTRHSVFPAFSNTLQKSQIYGEAYQPNI